jgi:hypothetical protein
MMVVIVTALAGCASSEPTVELVYTPEPLPEILASLPRQAKVKCRNDPVLDNGSVYIWSLPGTYLADPDSGVSGQRGDEIGEIEFCEPIQITEFYWDPYEARYWVKLENGDLVGWVWLDLISPE